MYYYDVASDYRYAFNGAETSAVPVTYKDGVIEFDSPTVYSNCYIEAVLSQTLFSRLHQLKVTFGGGSNWFEQYFEYGASGKRYINISPALIKGLTSQLSIKVNYGRIESVERAICFESMVTDRDTYLILAPHPDDAEIAAFGLYSSLENAYVVTVTAGDSGANKYQNTFSTNSMQYFNKGRARVWNSITTPIYGGVKPERAINMGFFDGTIQKMSKVSPNSVTSMYAGELASVENYRKMNFSPLSDLLIGGATWDTYKANLANLIEVIKPDVIVLPSPYLDTNTDHQYVSIGALEVLKSNNMNVKHLFLYSNHYRNSEYFPFGPNDAVFGLPPNFNEELYFDSIHNILLDTETRGRKEIALDSMLDLRLDQEGRTIIGAVKLVVKNLIQKNTDREWSHFRRGIKKNEQFFVVNIDNIDRITLPSEYH